MATTLTIDEIQRLAQLARLKLTEAEAKKYQDELNVILEYFKLLESADVVGLKATSQVTGLVNAMRKDVIAEQVASPDELLELAPARESRAVKVKRMI